MLKKLSNFFLPIGTLFLISLIITISWFRYGHLYGGGDVGLPTYDPIRLFNIVKNIWWDVHAPGFAYPTALTAIPFYLILVFLQAAGLSNFYIQVLTFGILIFLTGFGMYLLFSEATDSKSRILSFIAALFYMLNPYIVMQVWHRFVHTAFFLAALIPILTFLYIKITKTRKLLWLLCFLLISFIFSYSYGSLPFMIVLWIPIFTYSFWRVIERRSLVSLFENFSIFLVVFISWIITNVWWLYPFWTTGPATLTQMHSIYSSIATLLSLSSKSTMPMVLRGVNPFYIFGSSAWVPGYDNFLMQIISWTFPITTLVGIYTILSQRRKAYYIWILLFLIGVFISKGTAGPFGYPFLWFFSKSFILGAFRNPFEKFGIIVPLASAFIFPLGIQSIFIWLKSRFLVIVIILVLQFGVYAWPMWTGNMFGTYDSPAFVDVPDSYKKADEWIQAQGKVGRVLQLPFAPGDAITYNWQNGYNGVEPSSLLFGTPSISQGFGLDFLDNGLDVIRAVISAKDLNENDIMDVFSSFNIRYIVVHKDVDWKTRIMLDPEGIENLLSKISFIKRKAEFGDLLIYEVDNNLFAPKVYTTNISDVLIGGDKYFSSWPKIFSNRNYPISYATPINGNEAALSSYKDIDYSITPTQVIDVLSTPLAYKENALAELPTPRFLPGSPFYFLILLKERLEIFSTPILDRYAVELEFASKRLVEVYMLSKVGNQDLINQAMNNYKDKLDVALTLIDQKQKAGLINNVDKLILQREFARHEIVLVDLKDEKTLNDLKAKLSKMGLIPYYDLKEEMGMSKYGRRVYRFDVQKENSYEILLKDFDSKELYGKKLDLIPIQIDDNVKLLKINKKGEFIFLGYIELTKGIHEISYNTMDSDNLVPEITSADWKKTGSVQLAKDGNQEALEFSIAKDGYSEISIPLKNFDNNAAYRIDFDYWIKNGQGPNLQFQQSSDWEVDGDRFMDINKLYGKGNYNFFWNEASETLWPRSNANEATIKIIGEPWNNCLEILGNWSSCQDKQISQKYNRDSDFIIKNISLKRLFVNDIFLKSSNVKLTDSRLTEVNINQNSPSYYEGELDLEGPTSLVFLTTFHPEWKLSLIKNGKTEVVSEDKHFLANGYGNLWYLDKEPGNYKIKIEFLPQRRFQKGIVISIIGTIVLTAVLFLYIRKKKD
jgi:hypothetical protein